MKRIGGKVSSIMDVLVLGKRKHVHSQKSIAMKEWPTLGLDVLYDSFNARDGVVSDELIDENLTGILARMVFNARVELGLGTYSEEFADVGCGRYEEEKEISTNDLKVKPREYQVEVSREEGMRRWDVLDLIVLLPALWRAYQFGMASALRICCLSIELLNEEYRRFRVKN